MTPQILYSTSGKIWKLLFDDSGQYAVLEVRNEDLREASLTAINWAKGELLWEEGQLEEPWWISLSALAQGTAFVHLLSDEPTPRPQALIALDIAEGSGLWQADGCLLEACGKEGVSVLQAEAASILSYKDGCALPLQPPSLTPLPQPWQTPARYLAGEAHFETVARFLAQSRQQQALGAIDYWETSQYIVIGYYIATAPYYTNQLLILSKQGEVCWETQLSANNKGIGTESFGLQGHWLFYIAHKQQLCRLLIGT